MLNNGASAAIVLKGLPRQVLLKPEAAPYRLQGQQFKLGDRVMYVSDNGRVPLGARGIAVSVLGGAVEVVFNTTFMTGTTLQGRCSPFRGTTVKSTEILNLSNAQVSVTSNAQPAKGPYDPTRGGQPVHPTAK